MRTRMLSLVLLAFALGSTAGEDVKLEFQKFASSAGKYKIEFPGAVKNETIEVKTDSGAQQLTLDSVSFPGSSAVFMVTYIDVSEETAKAPAATRLDKIRDASKGTDGKVLSEKDLKVGVEKFTARDVVIEKPTVVIRSRIVLADRRLYQVMLQGDQKFVTSELAERFFDSFDVTK